MSPSTSPNTSTSTAADVVSSVLWSDCVLDISHNNGRIDWQRVDPSIALVFLKASQDAHFRDPLFEANRLGLEASGRICIPYHFVGPSDPDLQIANFEPFLKKGSPFMLDWEGDLAHTLHAEDVEYMGQQISADLGLADLDASEVLYAGITSSRPEAFTPAMTKWTAFRPRYRVSQASSFEDIPQAIRDGAANCLGTPLPRFWQYSEHGRVAGIAGPVDRSAFRGTLAELQTLYGKKESSNE